MKAVHALVVLLALCVVAVAAKRQHRLLNRVLGGRDQSSYDIYGMGVKDKLHERIAVEARQLVDSHYTRDAIKNGVRWNDMPSGDVNEFLNVVRFGIEFLAGEADAPGADTLLTIVYSSHFGCLQQLHSMAPEFAGRPNHAANSVYFTNAHVKALIRSQMKYMWNRAVAQAATSTTYSFYIGKMLHTVGDSYAQGHAVRGDITNYDNVAVGDAHVHCGRVIYFQGYGAQKNNDEHGQMDHDPEDYFKGITRTNTEPDRRFGIACTRAANVEILAAFSACHVFRSQWPNVAAATFPPCDFDAALGAAFDRWYTLSPSTQDVVAGGARDSMMQKDKVTKAKVVAGHTAKGITYNDLTGTAVVTQIWVPDVGARTAWNAYAGGDGVCAGGITAHTGALNNAQEFKDFHNTKVDGSDQNH